MRSHKSHSWDLVVLVFLTAFTIIFAAFLCSTVFLSTDKYGDKLMQNLIALGVFSFSLIIVTGIWIAFGDRDENDNKSKRAT
jgi:heme A synthase